ncbi:MAG: hypothetical protein HZB80_04035 [Deltaproteobacteria bacterium]|nr:hypothetical protein [Deltaproteobacteria bacterium]
MIYTLDFDIPDGKGGILYPKGFTFNPLDYVPFNKTIVVINGANEDEIKWFVESKYYTEKGTNITLLITDGEWISLSDRLKIAVFYLTTQISNRFRLNSTPSVIKRNESKMEVIEFDVKKNDNVEKSSGS